MFPYRDDNPTLTTPFVTIGVIVLTGLVWLVVQGAGTDPALGRSVCELGAIPGELLGRVRPGTSVPIGPRLACQIGDVPHWSMLIGAAVIVGAGLFIFFREQRLEKPAEIELPPER